MYHAGQSVPTGPCVRRAAPTYQGPNQYVDVTFSTQVRVTSLHSHTQRRDRAYTLTHRATLRELTLEARSE